MQIVIISNKEYIYNQLIKKYTQVRNYNDQNQLPQEKNSDKENIFIVEKEQAIELQYNNNITSIIKPFHLNQLIRAIEHYIAIINNKKIIEILPEVALDLASNQLFVDTLPIKLTDKEAQILYILYQNPDHILSKSHLLERVWGYNEATETHTIETHIYNLRQKLGDYAFLVKTEGEGYVLGY